MSFIAAAKLETGRDPTGMAVSFAHDRCRRFAAANDDDVLGRITRKTVGSVVVDYRYDLAGRLVAVNDNGPAVVRPVAPGGHVAFSLSASYDLLNRPLAISWSPAVPATPVASPVRVAFTHAYNPDNRRTGQTVSDNGWWNPPTSAAQTAYTADALNRYTAVGAVTPTYDTNGNLTSDGSYAYGYDAENRLTSASGGGTTASYGYDGTGHRKTVTVNGATTVYLGTKGAPDLLEWDGSTGALKSWTIPAPGANAIAARNDLAANTRATVLADLQGSVIGVLESSGTLTRLAYRPYGEGSGTFAFGYTGYRREVGTGLYHAHNRAYHPGWGRFIQTDPIGYEGGVNLYAYVGGDPLNWVDPLGLAGTGTASTTANVFNALLGINSAQAGEPKYLSIQAMAGEQQSAPQQAVGPQLACADASGCEQLALGFFERQLIPDSVANTVKSVLGNVTNNSLSSGQLNKAYDQVIRNIELDDAMLFKSINPNSNPIRLSPSQYNVVNQQIQQLSPDLRGAAQDGFAKAMENGRVQCPRCN